MKTIAIICVIAVWIVLIAGKGQEEQKTIRGEQVKKSTFVADSTAGAKLFKKNCNKCHPGGGKGKGPSLNDKNLPEFVIRSQVRLGIGKMPSFSKSELSKEDLDHITTYVTDLYDTYKAEENKTH